MGFEAGFEARNEAGKGFEAGIEAGKEAGNGFEDRNEARNGGVVAGGSVPEGLRSRARGARGAGSGSSSW